jgi:predicted dehydrogenase
MTHGNLSGHRKVRVAIVGLGFGTEFIPIHQRHPHAELVAVCRRSADKPMPRRWLGTRSTHSLSGR